MLIINRIGSVLSHSNLDQYPKVLLMETNQFQRFTSYPIPFIGHSQNAKYSNGEQISKLLGVKGGGGEGMITQKQHQGIFWNDGVIYPDCIGGHHANLEFYPSWKVSVTC